MPPTLRGAAGEYTAVGPTRVVDTRTGFGGGGTVRPIGAGQTLDVQIIGAAGIPAGGVAAVVLNVTMIEPSEATYLTVHPSGAARPEISNLNGGPGMIRANLVTVALGVGGRISIFNAEGSVHVAADVAGYYASESGTPGSRFTALTPSRLVDTRTGAGLPRRRLTGGAPVTFAVSGLGGVPAQGTSAVVLNVTVVDPSSAGYLTVHPADLARPNASNLNFAAGWTGANQVIVRLPASGRLAAVIDGGTADLIVDIVGYYSNRDQGTGGRFLAFSPFRAIDTRVASPFPGNGTMWDQDVLYAGPALPVDEPAAAYVLNVTVVEPERAGYLSLFPYPGQAPNSSAVNFGAGETSANHVVVATGPQVGIYHVGGMSHVVVDVFGAFSK